MTLGLMAGGFLEFGWIPQSDALWNQRPGSPIYGQSSEGVRNGSGWAPDGAVQDQIDDSITDAIKIARAKLPTGPGEIHYVLCGVEIPEARRHALPGAKTCVSCQSDIDGRPSAAGGINRRGSKDSQLK